ncbi:MAG: NAD(+)--dinitrogen-reductase ADP-D-ribosyltransferase [Azoarcus sp.]|jgi:NAD+--dinitrogen-reductase ADP-D-ribosyltransferase|nr:NAD(+)--dinitrogen-reductase ADP-D-ribosyltransferase [Azoarcus sp.]
MSSNHALPADVPPGQARLTLPPAARRPLNRCNLPAEALASFAFQLAPQPLELDGVLPLHRALFVGLDREDDPAARAEFFRLYMNAHFLLNDPPGLGLTPSIRIDRSRASYLKLLQGWLFDAGSREGAVLKAWVESRFGLVTRYHHGKLGHCERDGEQAREAFERSAADGLYNACVLEAQLDIFYAWSQYELARRYPGATHFLLYRGLSACALPVIDRLADGRPLVELNNLNSFSSELERADEFGNVVVSCMVPAPKIFAFPGLLPVLLRGEGEYLVIGGVVAVRREI